MSVLHELEERGLVHGSTDRDALAAHFAEGSTGVYAGFDPTADSLHLGHLAGLVTLRRFSEAGHRAFGLVGGATGMVGDPSGRSSERNLLGAEEVRWNAERVARQIESVSGAEVVDNADWTDGMTLLGFLRDVGKHVTVNQMQARDSVASRLGSENGLSFTEFAYMLLQANDFLHLNEARGVTVQAGGSDQWGNISLGVSLIRRRTGRVAHGVTWPLVTRPDGTKFGKTADGGNVWLDPERTTPFAMFQHLVNVPDSQAGELLMHLTVLPVETVRSALAEHAADPARRVAQHLLASEVTAIVHGASAAAHAADASGVVFGGGSAASLTVPVWEMIAAEVGSVDCAVAADGSVDLVGVLVGSGLAESNGKARRLVGQGGVTVNGERVGSERVGVDVFVSGFALVGRGRKARAVARLAP